MESDCLLTEFADGILTLILNRPASLNSLNQALRQGLLAALDEASSDPRVKAIVLRGAGRGFCAGADLKEPSGDSEMSGPGQVADRIRHLMATEFNPIIESIAGMPKPVVAAVNGITAGGGVGLALACDVVLCAASARFYQPFVPALGLVPDMGCTWFVPIAAGRARALAWALTGEIITAATALDWGLVWKVFDDGTLKAEARKLALQLAELCPETLMATRFAISRAPRVDLADQLHHEMDTQHRLASLPSYREGVLRFVRRSA